MDSKIQRKKRGENVVRRWENRGGDVVADVVFMTTAAVERRS
jgi:hypothetical protein